MSKHRRTWSQQEKLAIINYQKQNGTAKASREYGVSGVSISKWIRLYEENGLDGLKSKRKSNEIDIEKQKLERENRELKAIVAEKELTIRIQKEMLKKSH